MKITYENVTFITFREQYKDIYIESNKYYIIKVYFAIAINGISPLL